LIRWPFARRSCRRGCREFRAWISMIFASAGTANQPIIIPGPHRLCGRAANPEDYKWYPSKCVPPASVKINLRRTASARWGRFSSWSKVCRTVLPVNFGPQCIHDPNALQVHAYSNLGREHFRFRPFIGRGLGIKVILVIGVPCPDDIQRQVRSDHGARVPCGVDSCPRPISGHGDPFEVQPKRHVLRSAVFWKHRRAEIEPPGKNLSRRKKQERETACGCTDSAIP